MKYILQLILFLIFVNFSFAQNNSKIGLYCSKHIRKGLACVSLNPTGISIDVLLPSGSISDVGINPYKIDGDTIKIDNYMNLFYKDDALYMINNKNEVILRGGIKKARHRLILKIERRFGAWLKNYNLRIRNDLIEKF